MPGVRASPTRTADSPASSRPPATTQGASAAESAGSDADMSAVGARLVPSSPIGKAPVAIKSLGVTVGSPQRPFPIFSNVGPPRAGAAAAPPVVAVDILTTSTSVPFIAVAASAIASAQGILRQPSQLARASASKPVAQPLATLSSDGATICAGAATAAASRAPYSGGGGAVAAASASATAAAAAASMASFTSGNASAAAGSSGRPAAASSAPSQVPRSHGVTKLPMPIAAAAKRPSTSGGSTAASERSRISAMKEMPPGVGVTTATIAVPAAASAAREDVGASQIEPSQMVSASASQLDAQPSSTSTGGGASASSASAGSSKWPGVQFYKPVRYPLSILVSNLVYNALAAFPVLQIL